jgi:hypothetical protein
MSDEAHGYDFEQTCRLFVGIQRYSVPRFTIRFSPDFDQASVAVPLPERLVLGRAIESVLLELPGKGAAAEDRVTISLVPFPCPALSPQGHAHLHLRPADPYQRSILRQYVESGGNRPGTC